MIIEFTILEFKSSESFQDTNALIEKWSGIVFLLMVKVTPILIVVPVAVVSFFIYFTTEYRNDAFQLPIQLW